MNRSQSFLVLAAIAAITAAPDAVVAGPIAISSSTSVTSTVQIHFSDPASSPVVASDSSSQGADLSPLGSSAIATAAVDDSTSLWSSNSSTLSFHDAGSGAVVFSTAWEAPTGLNNSSVAGDLTATYTFRVEGAGLALSVNYTVETQGAYTFGLTGYSFSLTSQSTYENKFIDNNYGNIHNVSGTQVYSLIDGETYTLNFWGTPNLRGGIGVLNGATNTGTATFDFKIAAVPEPSSMVLAGLGLFGTAVYGVRARRAA